MQLYTNKLQEMDVPGSQIAAWIITLNVTWPLSMEQSSCYSLDFI